MVTKKNASRGKPVSNRDIERLAKEAEKGFNKNQMKRRVGRPTMGSAAAEVFPVRLDPELRKAIEKRAKKEHKTASDVIRDALRDHVA